MLHINFIILALFLNSVNNWNVYVGLGSDIQCMHACCHFSLLSTGQYLDTALDSPSRETRNLFIGPSEPRGCHTITFIELPGYTIEPLKQSVDAAQNEGRYVWALAAVFKASSIHSDNNVPSRVHAP